MPVRDPILAPLFEANAAIIITPHRIESRNSGRFRKDLPYFRQVVSPQDLENYRLGT